jgi:predicted nuclease with TOPRIM domain
MAPVRGDGGVEMNNHIPDLTKMISDTPRMQSALLDAPDAGFAKIWQVGCDIERELNAANAIIRQQQLLNEENLRLQERIKRLEEELIDVKNKHSVLIADVVLYEDRGDRIKRLEEAGDALCENSYPTMWDSPEVAALKLTDQSNWNKAKEDKL